MINKTCYSISPVPVERSGSSCGKCISSWRGTKKHHCSFWQMEIAGRRINYSTMTHSTQGGVRSIGTFKTCLIFMRCFSLWVCGWFLSFCVCVCVWLHVHEHTVAINLYRTKACYWKAADWINTVAILRQSRPKCLLFCVFADGSMCA